MLGREMVKREKNLLPPTMVRPIQTKYGKKMRITLDG